MARRRRLLLPVLVLLLGIAWLLNVARVAEPVNWFWVLLPGVVGVGVFLALRLTPATLAGGGFFLAAAGGSLLRQSGVMAVKWEVPVLVVVLGLLLLAGQFLPAGGAGRDPEEEPDNTIPPGV